MKIGNKNRKRGARDLSGEKDETMQDPEDTRRGAGNKIWGEPRAKQMMRDGARGEGWI